MATEIYPINKVLLFNNKELEIIPLKIKYLREFMSIFAQIKETKNDDEAIGVLVECIRVCMKQYCPEISTSTEDIENNFDLENIYKILDFAAGIKMGKRIEQEEESVKSQAMNSNTNWETFDLAKLESEVFLLGMWKNYQDLELSLSMVELIATLEASRDLDYSEKKFLAAMQGVDLDKESGKGQQEWEDLKARVFSGGRTGDSNDVLALQGQNARKEGFGIGMGLDYEDARNPDLMV